jgi:hypothetical protein
VVADIVISGLNLLEEGKQHLLVKPQDLYDVVSHQNMHDHYHKLVAASQISQAEYVKIEILHLMELLSASIIETEDLAHIVSLV